MFRASLKFIETYYAFVCKKNIPHCYASTKQLAIRQGVEYFMGDVTFGANSLAKYS